LALDRTVPRTRYPASRNARTVWLRAREWPVRREVQRKDHGQGRNLVTSEWVGVDGRCERVEVERDVRCDETRGASDEDEGSRLDRGHVELCSMCLVASRYG
jgi:hypothetical protein